MAIFKTKGYRDIGCLLSISAIFPPPSTDRTKPDKKEDDELAFHFTIVNDKGLETERSAYIELSKNQLRELSCLIDSYLRTGVTKEITTP